MFKVLRNSKYTTLIALSALIIAVGSFAFSVADAYSVRTTVLAKVLQTVGLCPVPETSSESAPTVTVTATPAPDNDSSNSPTPTAKETISPEPSSSPVKGAAGANGASGANGEDGNTGPTGASGEKGGKGDSGATGPQGPAGICDLSNILSVNGDLVPSLDNTYSLGTAAKRWKDLQVGPGTIWIQDAEVTPPTQVGLTVRSGALLLDGADSLRIGNMRLTNTGLTSIVPTSPITLGDSGFQSFVQLQANGLKFKDGTTQNTATVTGPVGPTGPQGPQGEQGAPGSVEGYVEVPACVVEDSAVYAKFTLVYAKCGEIEAKGRDIVILERKQ